MPSEDTKVLELNKYQKSDKKPCIICANVEYVIENTDRSINNPENLSTAKVGQHIPSGFSISTILSSKSM